MNLRVKIILSVILASSLCAIISISSFIYFNKKDLEFGIINRQRTIQNQLAAATNFVAAQNNLKPTIERIRAKYTHPDQLSSQDKEDIMNQVPIVASLRIGAQNAAKDHYSFRVFSDQPRNSKYKASAKELEIFDQFAKDPKLTELVITEADLISLYRPIRLSQKAGCLECHGFHLRLDYFTQMVDDSWHSCRCHFSVNSGCAFYSRRTG
jgi:methyl-accepting chemotaxis protein